MDLGFDGKTAFIFGGGRGMGAATGMVLAAEGARIVLFARGEKGLRDTAGTIEKAGGHAAWHTLDMTDTGDVEATVAEAISRHGLPDVMLISAGAAQGGVFWEVPDSVWDEAFALKFMGMIRVLRVVSPLMKKRGSGRIVVIVGNNGRQPGASMLPGSSANAACLAVVRGLAEELAPHGVTISALNPGPTRTDRWTTLIDRLARHSGETFEAVETRQLATMPKGRIGNADEMARLAAMLLSDHADMVTGVSLTADGGATKALA